MAGTWWRDDAACVGTPPAWWFPEDINKASAAGRDESDRMTAAALATCARCDVVSDCLDDALRSERHDRYAFGIRAGLLPQQRRDLTTTHN